MWSTRESVPDRKRKRIVIAVILGSIAVGAVAGLMAQPVAANPGQAGRAGGPAAGPTTHGFLFEGGNFTRIDHPDAVTATSVVGINQNGVMVGSFDDGAAFHGFVLDRSGKFIQLDYPGAASTFLHRINDAGQIVGAYVQTPATPRVGFVYDRGTFTPIRVRGAVETDANGINNAGQVAGWYRERDGRVHGMVWEDGAITTVDAGRAFLTELTDINDAGELVGDYGDPPFASLRGLFVSAGGEQTTFDAPGFPLTTGNGLNSNAQIVLAGTPDLSGETFFGFVLERGVGGAFTPRDVPGASSTQPYDIDDDGRVVGFYDSGGAAARTALQPADLDALLGRAARP